jgi:photosystem II stability/assembly factor-like uncharacterized protein
MNKIFFFIFLFFDISSLDASVLPDNIARRDKFFDIEIMGSDVWIVGFPSIILHSSDSGKTFEWQGFGEGEALFAVDFIDRETGFISGRNGTILATSDRGKNWIKKDSGTHEPLLDIFFADRECGWAVGNFGTIISTEDRGNTWTKQTLGEGNDAVLNAVFFTDRNTGWIAGEFGTIAKTENAGVRWTIQETGTSVPLFSIYFINAEKGIAAGAEGTILETSDSGKTWQAIDTGIHENLLKIAVNGKKTFVSGLDGMLLSKNEGENFTVVNTGIYNWLSGIGFNEEGVVIAVGSQKTLLYSSDFGKTFEKKQ